MKTLAKKALVALAGLVIAGAPLAASAQDRHDGGGDRGGYRGHEDRDHGDRDRGDHDRDWRDRGDHDRGWRDRDDHDRGWRDFDGRWVGYGEPVYRAPYVNGYFGATPWGWQGYYWNGNWYRHRRLSGSIWIYF